jgi:hypothetical protein
MDRKKFRAKAVRGKTARNVLLNRAALRKPVWFPGDPREWRIVMIEFQVDH